MNNEIVSSDSEESKVVDKDEEETKQKHLQMAERHKMNLDQMLSKLKTIKSKKK